MYPCERCEWISPSYNALIEHGQKMHGDKQVDPGNEFSSPSKKKLLDVIAWVRKQPDANLKTGEGKLLLDEIDRLASEALIAATTNRDQQGEIDKLTADFAEALDNLCMAFVGGRGCDSDIVAFLNKHGIEDPR